MSTNAFDRYADFIQQYIYRKKWTDLREIQVKACEAILDTEKHIIIASGTASGKTEAAFFPMLTLMENNPSRSIGIMYIGPLKALINDQFERLNELLEDVGIPVWSWHGDVSSSHKKKALKIAKGILQITPESLEALLIRHPGNIHRLFSDLKFIVIDEIHALMGEDRGLQVLCLINRLEKIAGCNPRRIGLSATLNDYNKAMEFLALGSAKDAISVVMQGCKRIISLCAESFVVPDDKNKAIEVMNKYNNFIYDNCHNKKCLIFTNSRNEAEQIILTMKNIAKSRNEKTFFYTHHGNVSSVLRKEAENALKENSKPTVVAATLTLELGIDIGNLDSTIQIGAPYTCSSFVQRLGRSGRRTGKSQMMFLNLHREPTKNPLDSLPWDLLRSIAIIQLYLEEKWVEPFEQKKKPFSLLAHQTLSIIMTYGELFPSELAKKVLLLPAFKTAISLDEYRALLRYMIEKEYLQRIDNGKIIIGLTGEKICNHYSFYAVFQDETTYKVLSKEGEVGTLNNCPEIGEIFVLAGEAWVVVTVDQTRRIIYVNRAKSIKIPIWDGNIRGDTHSKVMQRIKKVLQEDVVYPYLQKNAKKVLVDARNMARNSNILMYDVTKNGEKTYNICPWVGTKEICTISELFNCGLKEQLDIRSVTVPIDRYYLSFTSTLEVNILIERLKNLNFNQKDPNLILGKNAAPQRDKYDYMVPNELLRTAYLHNHSDLYIATQILKKLHWG